MDCFSLRSTRKNGLCSDGDIGDTYSEKRQPSITFPISNFSRINGLLMRISLVKATIL